MSVPRPAWVAGSLLLALGLALPAAPSQEADKPPTSKPATAEPVAPGVRRPRRNGCGLGQRPHQSLLGRTLLSGRPGPGE